MHLGISRWVSRKTDKCDDGLDADSRAVITEALKFENLCAKCDKYRLDKRRDGPGFDIITRVSSRSNTFVRDVMIHKQCKAKAGAQVMVDGVCWQHVHEDEMNVYDFTFWADAHDDPKAAASLKEGSKAVAAFAETGSAEFKWTGSMPLWYATTRDRRMKIGLLGAFGNNVDFVAIPLDSRVEQIARVVGSEKRGGDASTEVCGSPGEVASDPSLGDTVNMNLASGESGWRQTRNEVFDTRVAQKGESQMVFQNVILSAQDQLRQRVAWALNQIFVIDQSPIYRKKSGDEHFLNYFDIFVRNAFGNYRDILQEVSYSPMMGYMLTYCGSKSRKVTGNAPDENYAREIMQLFSMGLYKLHENGTSVIDAKGEPELAYSIDDIATLSAGWTGFRRSQARANMEDSVLMRRGSGARFLNVIDPMYVAGSHRDTNPKRTPTNGYIGDGKPLCTDLPKRAFLKTGAEFRYLGSNPAYDKLKGSGLREDGDYTSSSGADFELKTDSALYKVLCGAASGLCKFKSVLTLSENLSCKGSECNLDEVRIVKLASAGAKENGERYDVYYEYVRQPCVHHSFFANPTVVTSKEGMSDHPWMSSWNRHGFIWGYYYRPMCVNPKTLAAQAACCPKTETGKRYRWRPQHKKMVDGKFTGWGFKVKYIDTKNVATSSCDFVNEHVTYATAAARCEAKGEELCDFTALSDAGTGSTTVCEKSMNQFWRPGKCTVNAQITIEGQVSIVDDIPHMDKYMHPEGAKLDSTDTFRVVWADGKFPVAETGCGGGACTVRGNTCVCSTTLSNDAVFTTLPSSRNEVISKLTAGAVDPTTLDTDTYTIGAKNFEVTVYFLKSNPGWTTDAIVKVGDGSKSSKPLFFKNFVSTVFMGDKSTGFSFRNPVSFHSKYERTTRDAEHETNAILDYYFNHPNVAPFFANNMIQRFVTSNPSPSYVQRVATAFKTGAYNSFGTGSRGDLAATMAAVLMDDEAQSPLSQKDPTFGRIREPVIKWLTLMRSMDFKRNEQNIHSMSLVNMNLGTLGQNPYSAPSVFSWFDYDYAPVGVIDKANLVAPEAKLINPANIVKFINGAHSLIRFGLGNCDGGLANSGAGIGDSGKIDGSDCHNFYGYELGRGKRARGKGELPTPTYIEDTSLGMLKYSPASKDPSDAAAIVKELDQVLTGGRLDPHQLSVITAAYSAKYKETGDASEALKAAQLLLVVTPEFHSSAPNKLTATERPADATKVEKAAPRPYKAIIYMWLGGGMDSYNMLVPLDGCKDRDMYAQYKKVRTDMALEKEFLLPITASKKTAKSGQVCDRFGLHPRFKNLQRLYNDGDALFFANAGMLTMPITKKEYLTKSKPVPKPLHGHNTQTRYTQSADGANVHRKNGVLGRLNDAMTQRGSTTASYEVGGGSGSIGGVIVLNSEGISLPVDELSSTGSVSVLSSYSKGIEGTIDSLTGRVSTSPLAETMAHGVQRAIKRSKKISEMMKSTTCLLGTNAEFKTKYGHFASKFEVIARSIKANAASVHTERETYYLGMGGFDTHFSATDGLHDRFGYVDKAIEGFEKEMKAQGLWDSVVLVQASEFGRMLTSNGDGTGHGWGGHYFLTGGGVKGGQILGEEMHTPTHSLIHSLSYTLSHTRSLIHSLSCSLSQVTILMTFLKRPAP
jgi:cullin-associated NEDD8-dissociated protein 1